MQVQASDPPALHTAAWTVGCSSSCAFSEHLQTLPVG